MTIIHRKVYEPGGLAHNLLGGKCQPLARNISHLESKGRGGQLIAVTWDEVMTARRIRQAERMDRICSEPEPELCPCYVWTFFKRQDIPYHGWYCYVISRHFEIGVNYRGFKSELAISIMQAIPLGLLPVEENFSQWMQRFAKTYPRKHKLDRRKAGTHLGWIYQCRHFTLESP